MAENSAKEEGKEHCSGRKCGGCKFLAGIIVGLLMAGTGFGLYMAGRSHGCHARATCPFMQGMMMQGKSTK